jgi:signal transduction histidine kinase
VETELRARDDSLRADPEELEGVFLNLFLNAAEAMPDGGRLRVATSNAASRIWVTVSDTGPGVNPEMGERIFDPFFSTKRAGSGLGLSVALQRVEAIGGMLRLAGRVTDGARFVVELPQAVSDSRAERLRENEEGS